MVKILKVIIFAVYLPIAIILELTILPRRIWKEFSWGFDRAREWAAERDKDV